MKRLEALYDSEINWSISCFWDAGYRWRLGDEMNGWRAEGDAEYLEGAIAALCHAAEECYSDSSYAKEVLSNRK